MSTGAYIVSPTAKTPKVVTKRAAASSGDCDALASSSHDRVQMAATPMSRLGALRWAVSRTTTIWSAMMTTQLTAAARPMTVSSTDRTVSA